MKQLFKKFNKNERGIALIFALSILALLLVMALAFTTNSMFERKVAINSSRGSTARLLAQSVAQQLEVVIAAYNGSDEVKCSKGIIDIPNAAGTGTIPDQPTYDMLDKLTTIDGKVTLFKWNESAYKDYINWQYVKAGNNIIGRYAFVIQPAYGIDANYLTKPSVPGVDEGNYGEKRVGVEYNEMNVRSVSEADITSTIAGDFNYNPAVGAAPIGKFTGDWVDFSTMFDAAHLNITDGILQAKFRKWFVIGANKNREAFWSDVVEDGAIASATELFHRFNLKRTGGQWTALGNTYPPNAMYEQILLDKLPATRDGVPDAIPTIWSNANNDGEGIPWLAFAGYKSDGTPDTDWGETFGKNAAGVIARRRQIAANLVDYCDGNIVPTSDVDPNTWDTMPSTPATTPSFTGNDITPYINELVIEPEYTVNVSGSGPYTVDGTVTVNVGAEIIDLYDRIGLDFDIEIFGSITTGEIKVNGAVVRAAKTQSITISKTLNAGNWGVNGTTAKGYNCELGAQIGTLITAFFPATNVLTNTPAIEFGAINLTLDRIVLKYGGHRIDMVNFGKIAYPGFFPAKTATVGVTEYLSRSLSCKDPRQNLNAFGDDLDWNFKLADFPIGSGSTIALARTAAHVTLGKSNYHCDPAYAYATFGASVADRETATDQKDVSTGFLSNEPMKSPWELGFIHRGAPYQTINLTEYDPNKAVKYIAGPPDIMPGAGKFSDSANGGGDANILDQVKFTDSPEMKKVNINTQYVDPDTGKNFVLQALLNKIQMGCTPVDAYLTIDSLAIGGTHTIEVPNSDLDNLITAIVNRASGINYLTRAEVANCKLNSSDTTFALSNGTCGIAQTTNAMQEELISKFINLTDVAGSAEYFNIIILAQTIKDVGLAKINLNGTKVTTKFGQFDYRLDGGKYYYADEVTSEQKIKILLHYAAGKCTILRYEYVE